MHITPRNAPIKSPIINVSMMSLSDQNSTVDFKIINGVQVDFVSPIGQIIPVYFIAFNCLFKFSLIEPNVLTIVNVKYSIFVLIAVLNFMIFAISDPWISSKLPIIT